MKNIIKEPTKFPFQMDFLDLEIVNSGNSDGFVVVKRCPLPIDGLWQGHLGNYSTLRGAMKGAFLYFMIARPQHFSSQIFHRLIGTKTSHEWFTFTRVCEIEEIEIPKWMYISNDTNCTIETDFEDALQREKPFPKESDVVIAACDLIKSMDAAEAVVRNYSQVKT